MRRLDPGHCGAAGAGAAPSPRATLRNLIRRRIEVAFGVAITRLGDGWLAPTRMSALVSGALVKSPTRAAMMAAWVIVRVRNMMQIERSSVEYEP